MKTINVKYVDTTEVTCNISYCTDSDSPRDWDNLGKMVLSHKRYNLPNEVDLNFDNFDGWDEVEKYLRDEHDAYIVLPVQMYDHSGVSIYVGNEHDRWDGGQLGFIMATGADIRSWFGVKRITKEVKERAIQTLNDEVEAYDQWQRGEIYDFVLEDKQGNVLDSCCGWYNIQDIKDELKEYENITFKLDGEEL